MADSDQELRLNFSANTATIQAASQALKEYVATTNQVVAIQEVMSASADSTNNLLGLEADQVLHTSSELTKLENNWQAAADAKQKYANIPDPTVNEALGDFGGDSNGDISRGRLAGSLRLL